MPGCGWQAIDREAQDKTKAVILNLCNDNDVSFGKFILFSVENIVVDLGYTMIYDK